MATYKQKVLAVGAGARGVGAEAQEEPGRDALADADAPDPLDLTDVQDVLTYVTVDARLPQTPSRDSN